MTVENPALVTWAVLIILVLVFFQGIVLGLALLFLGRQISSARDQVGRLVGLVSQLLDQTDRFLGAAESVHAQLPATMSKISSSLGWFNRKMVEVDELSVPLLSRLSGGLAKVNDQTDRLLSGFGSTTYRIHRAIINPARHLSAAISAVQESLLWLFNRGRKPERELLHPDDENFI